MARTQFKSGWRIARVLPEWGSLINLGFFKALPLTFVKFSLGRIKIFNRIFYGLVVGSLFLLYGGLATKGFIKEGKLKVGRNQLAVSLWFILPVLLAWLASAFAPNYQPFRLLLVLPAFYILLVFGIFRIKAVMVRTIVAVVILLTNLVSLGVYYFNPYFQREDWRGVVNYVESQANNSLALLPSPTSNWPWRYYAADQDKLATVAPGVSPVAQKNFNAALERRLSGDSVYYIRYLVPLFDPGEKINSWLNSQGFVKIKEVSFNQIPVWEYERQ
jgi:hypothetical protein